MGSELRVVIDGFAFEVRQFTLTEGLQQLFRLELAVVSPDMDADLNALIGADARFEAQRVTSQPPRSWSGLVTLCEHVAIDDDQLSTYRLVVEPELWLLTQRRNYRVFQQQSDPEVVLAVLQDWGLEPRCAYDAAAYLGRKYRVQYAESDFAFISRLLEDSGITFFFEEHEGRSRLVLSDAPQSASSRDALPFEHRPVGGPNDQVVTRVRLSRHVRPGRYTQRDVDWRRSPEFPLMATHAGADGIEARLERFHHNYGAFLYSARPSGDTPVADDRGAARSNLEVGGRQVRRRLAAKRSRARRISFETTAHDVAPGTVLSMEDHPRPDLNPGRRLLVVAAELTGEAVGEWSHRVEATFADQPYHPPLRTPKPRTRGLESGTVVGSPGDEIHTDELARVRVQFHWDRVGGRDERASCWIPVNQPWGGNGFGGVNIPRVGQEVVVDFLGEDPDRPVVIGRVFTKTNPVPYELPKHKTVSGIRSHSANQGFAAAAKSLLSGMASDAAESVLADAVKAATGAAFGPVETPLGAIVPEVAGMLAKFALPGGVSFLPPEAPGGAPVASPAGRPSPAAAPPGATSPADRAAPAADAVADAPPPVVEEPMGMARMDGSLATDFPAVSPTGETHRWVGSEVTMDDTFGKELLYVQAQKNQNQVAKNNWTEIVGKRRLAKIGTSDVVNVGRHQLHRVGTHRGVDVHANQVHTVTGDIEQTCVEGSQRFKAAEWITTTSKTIVLVGEQVGLVSCGSGEEGAPLSSFLLMPEMTMIQGDKLFLNPGPEALARALSDGEAPETAAEMQAAAKQAAVDGARAVYETAWDNGELSAPEDRFRIDRQHRDQLDTFGGEARNQAWREFNEAHPRVPDSPLHSRFKGPDE